MNNQKTAPKEAQKKSHHLIKNVPDTTWLEFRVMALENKLEMNEALKMLLDSHRELQKLKPPKKSA